MPLFVVCGMLYVLLLLLIQKFSLYPRQISPWGDEIKWLWLWLLIFFLIFVVFLSLGVGDSGTVRKIEITVVSWDYLHRWPEKQKRIKKIINWTQRLSLVTSNSFCFYSSSHMLTTAEPCQQQLLCSSPMATPRGHTTPKKLNTINKVQSAKSCKESQSLSFIRSISTKD